MRGHDPLGRGPPVGVRQRQAVPDVGLDRRQEGVLAAALEELDLDGLLALGDCGEQAVHAVDHPHAAPVDQDRRKRSLKLRQPGDVLLVPAVRARRLPRQERGDRNGDDVPRRNVSGPDNRDRFRIGTALCTSNWKHN